METLREIFDPNFLLRNSVYISLLVGFMCPLVGLYLMLRRLVFMGVALPQVSSCGIALAFALHAWHVIPHIPAAGHTLTDERTLAFMGATGLTVPAILLLSVLVRRTRGAVEGLLGTAYVLAGAWGMLLLAANPLGEHGMLDLLKGQILAITDQDLLRASVSFVVVLGALLVFKKEFLLVSFDREMAIALGKNTLFWDLFLFLLIGLTISMAVISVGPLVAFGFLLLPPLTAHLFARNMRQFAVLSAAIGVTTALAGFCLAYKHDLPPGSTQVALLGVVYGLAALGQKVWNVWHAGLTRRGLNADNRTG
jgi:ABC-type Mn2+/Zn2+ transport system permease subunit